MLVFGWYPNWEGFEIPYWLVNGREIFNQLDQHDQLDQLDQVFVCFVVDQLGFMI